MLNRYKPNSNIAGMANPLYFMLYASLGLKWLCSDYESKTMHQGVYRNEFATKTFERSWYYMLDATTQRLKFDLPKSQTAMTL